MIANVERLSTGLKNKNFAALWLGQSFSQLGDVFYKISLLWIVLRLSGSATDVGMVLMIGAVPQIGFFLLGGALSDRLKSPKLLIVLADAFRGVLLLILYQALKIRAIGLNAIFITSFLLGIADGFFQPALKTIIPLTVTNQELQSANALFNVTGQVFSLLAPVLGGFIAASKADIAVLLNAISFLVAAGMGAFVRVRREAERLSFTTTYLGDLRQSFLHLIRNNKPIIVFVCMIMVINAGMVSRGVVLPVFLNQLDGSKVGADFYGSCIAAIAFGSLGVSLVLSRVQIKTRRGMIMLLSILLLGISFMILPFARSAEILTFLAINSAVATVFSILHVTYVETSVPTEHLGRVNGITMFGSRLLMPLSMLGSGIFAQKFGARMVFISAGLLISATSFVGFGLRSMRTLD